MASADRSGLIWRARQWFGELLQIALLGVAVFFTFGRRAGPDVRGPATFRAFGRLEFVDTLGAIV